MAFILFVRKKQILLIIAESDFI